jgi:hypothetical protein
MTFMPKMLKKPLGDMSFNDQKMIKTQPNCINAYIFGFSVKRSTKLAESRLATVNSKKAKKSAQFLWYYLDSDRENTVKFVWI